MEQKPQIEVAVGTDGHKIIDPDSGDLLTDPPTTVKDSEDSAIEGSPQLQPQQLQQSQQPQPQPQQPQQLQPLRTLIDRHEMSEKMAELHKNIKKFWLCGQIDENGKFIDMTLERQRGKKEVPEKEVEKVTV